MKKSNTKSSAQSQDFSKEKKPSLFDSIIEQENRVNIENEIHKRVSRVGLVLKVLYGRDLMRLRSDFERDLSLMLQTYCEKIDNELSAT